MKTMRVLTVLGLVLAISGVAGAITIGGKFIPNGPLVMKFINFDVGVLYDVDNGLYEGEATLDGLPQTPPVGGAPGEDTWGIFRLTDIMDITQTITYYSVNDPTTTEEVTGIFYGERDTYLNQTGAGATLTQDIHGVGLSAAFFVGPKNFDPSGGPDDRDTPNPDYPTATDGTLVWSFNSVPGWDTTFPEDEFFTTFRPNAAANSQSANGGFFAETGAVPFWGEGIWNSLLDPNAIAPGVAGRFDFTGNPGPFDWIVRSNDPIQVSVIPEPITMMGVLAGLSGLAGYIRRRRA